MKTSRIPSILVCAAIFAAGACLARAADDVKTISGEAKCAKCILKEQDACQTVIQVKEGDKTVSYYVADNDVAKAFHPTVCKQPQKVTATGTVTEANGRLELTASKIEVNE